MRPPLPPRPSARPGLAAALVFGHTHPGGVELATDNSGSYAEWLCQRPEVSCCSR